jgi:hypothetical protein
MDNTMMRSKPRRLAAAVTTVVLVGSSVVAPFTSRAAGLRAGDVEIVDAQGSKALRTGGSQTPFALKAPAGASCTGSSSENGYFVTGFVTPEAIDPSTLHFDYDGPHSASPSDKTYHLIDTNGSPYIELNTAGPDTSGQGALLPTPALTWKYFDLTYLPPGTYHVGLACTHSPGDGTRTMDRFWDTAVVFSRAGDDPGGFSWSVPSAGGSSSPGTSVNGSTWALLVVAAVGVGAAGFAMRRSRRSRREASLAK